jgi:hydrogenase maturation protein HypF
MGAFVMCDACKKEYEDPKSRRYHAQPTSCYDCGPKLEFIDMTNGEKNFHDPIDATIKKIQEGVSVAVKGLGGFHIVCDATNEAAVMKLRRDKHRPTKPFAVMFQSLREIKKVAKLSKKEEELLLSQERPIVLVTKKPNSLLAKSIAPNIDKIGVFLAYTPLHELLLEALKAPIVATSANISDEPIITKESDIIKKLPLVVDAILTHNRAIVNACDDSVVMSVNEEPVYLRLARGLAPKSFYLANPSKKRILALGANQKNTLAFAFDKQLVLSAHIGDLNSIEAFGYFTKTLETFKRIYDFEPDVIVCDKHPRYETTLWAKEYVASHADVELIELQHHYAHALATMAEYNCQRDVLAFCFDGTGYGDDKTLWGGEVLIASPQEYKRVFSLQNIYLLGGEKAVREPRRVGLALLFENYSFDTILKMQHPLVESFTAQELKTLYRMFEKKINTPKSSSIGRLFDAVYALSGFVDELGYEGESGLIMETLAKKSRVKSSFRYEIDGDKICYKPMIEEILKESSAENIAAKFINTLSKIIIEIAQRYPDLPVVLSGGVFQNRLLLAKVSKALERLGREYLVQHQSTLNDGSISLGQAYYAVKKYEGKQ